MAALLQMLARGWTLLIRLLRGLTGVVGSGNLLGWSVAAVIPVAYVGIWVGVLTFAFSSLITWFIGSSPDIFGGSSFPSGAMWLLNQTFPLPLMFSTTVSLLVLRASGAALLATAITASRFLKS
jgi:hypothetical protein